ncbi:protein kinase family protein [Terrisporobacter sp.]|uniref:protein kinase family protein n=1 Tax=Terrisporobacter sp. TaxID=1965305 RepID=UPI0039910596
MKRFNETYGKRQFLSRNEWADTYKAIHSESEEKVIVKVLVNKSTDEEYINNLSKEVKILKEIKNPNLIHINNMFQYSACGKTYYYIESEYFKGISLGEKIENNKLEEKEAINMVKEICESINEFHSNNLSFNILSLENILINSNNQIKIDTLSYLENKRFVENEEENIVKVFNPQSDIYDIGVILYNLLSGKTTFDKNKYKKDIKDKNLLRVIEKATNKNDEYKYENINRLIIDLKSYLLSGEIKLDDFKEEVKVVQQSKNKKNKKEKTKKEKIKKEKTKKIQTKEVKDKELKRDNKTEENKEKKKRKKGKFGKAFGICAVITIAAGAGIYAYDFIEKNYKNEDTKVEENIENNKTENLVDKNENIKSEENKKENKEEKVDVKKEETKKEDKINKSEKVNSTTKKEETNTNSSSNNSSSNKGNTNNTSKPNNNTVNKPSNNTTNKPSNNTSNSSNNTTNKPNNNTSKPNNNTNKPNNNTTNKPNNNQNSGNTNNKPEIENKPESTTKPDDSNNSGNDNVDEQPPSSEIEGE